MPRQPASQSQRKEQPQCEIRAERTGRLLVSNRQRQGTRQQQYNVWVVTYFPALRQSYAVIRGIAQPAREAQSLLLALCERIERAISTTPPTTTTNIKIAFNRLVSRN